jgi:hypothetical protein
VVVEIKAPSRVFVAGPLTGRLGRNGLLPQGDVRLITSLNRLLRSRGHRVFNAHELEQWGRLTPTLTSRQIFVRDSSSLSVADYLIIFIGHPGQASSGAAVEFGWATAKMFFRLTKKNAPNLKGILLLRQKDVVGDSRTIEGAARLLQQKEPDKFEVVEFSSHSDLVREIGRRLQPQNAIHPAERAYRRLRLGVGSVFNVPRSSKYFTKAPRRRPI